VTTDSERDFQRRGYLLPGYLLRRPGEPTTLRDIAVAERDLDAYYRQQVAVLDRMRRFIKAATLTETRP
jgi:hypothetical protein